MNGFDAYTLYIALRNHFTTSYDFVKFNGKVKATVAAYEKRRDTYQFRRLGALADPKFRLISCFLEDITFINDILGTKGEAAEKKHRRIVEGGTYIFKDTIQALTRNLENALVFKDGRYPELLQKYINKQIPIQHVLVIDSVLGCLNRWDRQLTDDLLWPEIRTKLFKYRQLYSFDKHKYRQIIVDHFINT